jgi:hypothetical protein
MSNQDIRWKQRFVTFEKVFLRLSEFMNLLELNEMERNK